MAHALLSGTDAKTDTVAALLSRWGLTCECLGDRPLGPDDFSPTRCDLVIVVCAGGVDPAPFPSLADSGAGHVPLLLVGGNHGTSRRRMAATEQIDSSGRDGECLHAALTACLGPVIDKEAEPARFGELRDYFHYLNHETRTPLTAAQTALQILDAEFGEVAADSPQHDVLRIAMRNLKRLGETLRDTEICLAERLHPSTPCWTETTVGDLLTDAFSAADLHEVAGVFRGPAHAATRIVGDPALLGIVLRQLHGVLCRYCVQGDFAFQAGIIGDDEIRLAWTADASADFGKVSRTGLISERAGDEDELPRLIRFSLSRELLQLLGGRVTCDDSEKLLVELILPLRPGKGAQAVAEPFPALQFS